MHELEAQLASERYNLVNYENQRVNALLTLTQLLELRDVPGFDVEVHYIQGIKDGIRIRKLVKEVEEGEEC